MEKGSCKSAIIAGRVISSESSLPQSKLAVEFFECSFKGITGFSPSAFNLCIIRVTLVSAQVYTKMMRSFICWMGKQFYWTLKNRIVKEIYHRFLKEWNCMIIKIISVTAQMANNKWNVEFLVLSELCLWTFNYPTKKYQVIVKFATC